MFNETSRICGELLAAGFTFWTDSNRLRYVGPAGGPSVAQRAHLVSARDAIVEYLDQLGGRLTPVSSSQRRLHAAQAIDGTSCAYLIPLAWRIEGTLHADHFESSVRLAADRHDALRQAFVRLGDEVAGIVLDHCDPDVMHFRALDIDGPKASAVLDEALADAMRPFDLSLAPLWRLRLVHMPDDQCHMILVMHHMICDECSSAQLLQELALGYRDAREANARTELDPSPQPPSVTYRDYVAWERSQAERSVKGAILENCCTRISKLGMQVGLPVRSRRLSESRRVQSVGSTLSAEISASVGRVARKLNVSEFVLLLTVFVMLLARYRRSSGVLLVTPVTTRLEERFFDVLGPMQNLAIIAAQVSSDKSLTVLCAVIAEQVEETFAPDYPALEQVVNSLSYKKNGDRLDALDVMFVKSTLTAELAFNDFRCTPMPLSCEEAKTTLLAGVGRENDKVRIAFEFRPDVLDPDIVYQMLGDYEGMISAGLEDAAMTLRSFDERQRSRSGNVAVACTDPAALTLIELLDKVFTQRADDMAILGTRQLRYCELAELCERIVRKLPTPTTREQPRVLIWGRPSVLTLAAMIGSLRHGKCIVPIDSDVPVARVITLCRESSQCTLLLDECPITPDEKTGLERAGAHVLTLAELADDRYENRSCEPAQNPHPHALAYVMYTSGSTGEPKGVGVSHQAFSRFITWAIDELELNKLPAFNVLTHAAFDVSLFEFFAPLLSGCPLHLVSEGDYRSRLKRATAGGLAIVPSVLRAALAAGDLPSAPTHFYVAGEDFPVELAVALFDRNPDVKVFNLYGPTEAVVYTSVAEIEQSTCAELIPIGRARTGVHCHVLSDDGMRLPWGVVGELAIGGAMAREYVGMPRVTASSFVPDPFSQMTGARLYLTGDLVRENATGDLFYVARRDRQLKCLGVRIEPEEIERVLCAHPAVTAAVVCVSGQPAKLTGFVEAVDSGGLVDELKAMCSSRLPRTMLPQHIDVSPQLARTPAGKVDAVALHSRDVNRGKTRHDASRSQPASVTEGELMQVWSEVLGHDAFDKHTNFFEAGGNSYTLLVVHERLMRERDSSLTATDLFIYPTVCDLAARLDGLTAKSANAIHPSKRADAYKKALRRHRNTHATN